MDRDGKVELPRSAMRPLSHEDDEFQPRSAGWSLWIIVNEFISPGRLGRGFFGLELFELARRCAHKS